jgi:D-alanine transaminase
MSSAAEMFAGIKEVYLNGEFCAPHEANVSAFDRGFIFGDGIYEVVPAYGGQPFRLEQHLDRLDRNLATVRIARPMSRDEWRTILDHLLSGSPGKDQYVYIQVTRGIAPRIHAYPEDTVPSVFVYSQGFDVVSEALLRSGVTAILRQDIRWRRCDLKTTSLIANTWLRQEAREEGAEEAILVRDGFVTEGAASNVFVVSGGQILTPPNGPNLLPGVTRDLLVELIVSNELDLVEQPVSDETLLAADEVWISSSVRELLPVVKIDDRVIGEGQPGPVFIEVNRIFQQYKDVLRTREK